MKGIDTEDNEETNEENREDNFAVENSDSDRDKEIAQIRKRMRTDTTEVKGIQQQE